MLAHHAKWFFRFILIAAVLWASEPAHTQSLYKDTLFLKASNPDHLSEYYQYYYEPEAQHTPVHQIDSLFRAGNFRRWHKWHLAFNPGLTQSDVWFRVTVKNTLGHGGLFLWTVYNHMDSIYLYKQTEAGFSVQSSLSGSAPADKGLLIPEIMRCHLSWPDKNPLCCI